MRTIDHKPRDSQEGSTDICPAAIRPARHAHEFGANVSDAFVTVSRSGFKKNPAAVLRDAKSRLLAVLSHNKAAFYMVEPALFEAMLEELANQDLHRTVLSRMGERARAIEVDTDTI